jgi:hypothetical protein
VLDSSGESGEVMLTLHTRRTRRVSTLSAASFPFRGNREEMN